MKKILAALIILFTFPFTSLSQNQEFIAEGKVLDARTRKGVKATIRFSSLPTGSIQGKFTDSLYSFSIYGTARYQVTAEASGYNPKTIIVNPEQLGKDKRIVNDIKLMPAGATIRLNHLIFSQGKSEIEKTSFSELNDIELMMKENPKMIIQLEGHTDNQGSPDANMQLSQARVEAVKKYLTSKGIKSDRIKTKAFGGTQPLKSEQTQEARALNRRVEMRILKD